MLRNYNLSTKLNLVLLAIFAILIAIVGSTLSMILLRNAEQVVTDQAMLLIETMSSVRNYTSSQVKPELDARVDSDSEFLPQTIPFYSAREVFEDLRARAGYNDFFYKEAALNPMNLRDKADEFETKLIDSFREQPYIKEKTGFRAVPGGNIFYIARPITVSQESCLECHGSANLAPKTITLSYGTEHGFNWKFNDTVAAQIISVPSNKIFNFTHRLQFLIIGSVVGFFLLAVALINILLKLTVTKPIKRMAQWARQVSTGNMTGEFVHKSNDEIGILAASLNRLKVSLEMAMSMLDSKSSPRRSKL